MTRVAVCVRQVLDGRGPLSLTDRVNELDGLVPIANPADMCALALARQTEFPEAAEVIAIGVGPEAAEVWLRKSLALGADRAIRVWDPGLEPGNVYQTARVLAKAIDTLWVDLTLCGASAMDSTGSYLGPAVAEALQVPLISCTSHLEACDDGAIIAHRKLDRGDREIVRCRFPALVTVEVGTIQLPYASLPALIQAELSPIEFMSLSEIGIRFTDVRDLQGARPAGYVPPRLRTKKTAAPDTNLSPAERMRQMMMGGAAKKAGNLVEAGPGEAAEAILRFLETNGFSGSRRKGI